MKFATISLVVPASLTQTDAMNIIPHLSLTVVAGFTPNSISSTAYPCVETYSGANKDAIDTVLQAQESCALQTPVCRAQGPVAVGPGGRTQFTFPLDNNVCDDVLFDDDTQQLRSSIFIDFMVAAVDANGNQLITNLQTSTVLKRTSVLSRCWERPVRALLPPLLLGALRAHSLFLFVSLLSHTARAGRSPLQVCGGGGGCVHFRSAHHRHVPGPGGRECLLRCVARTESRCVPTGHSQQLTQFTHKHTHTRIHIHTHTHTHTHTQTYTPIHKKTRTHTHKHTHTYIHSLFDFIDFH